MQLADAEQVASSLNSTVTAYHATSLAELRPGPVPASMAGSLIL
jgi:hypothetical protein